MIVDTKTGSECGKDLHQETEIVEEMTGRLVQIDMQGKAAVVGARGRVIARENVPGAERNPEDLVRRIEKQAMIRTEEMKSRQKDRHL